MQPIPPKNTRQRCNCGFSESPGGGDLGTIRSPFGKTSANNTEIPRFRGTNLPGKDNLEDLFDECHLRELCNHTPPVVLEHLFQLPDFEPRIGTSPFQFTLPIHKYYVPTQKKGCSGIRAEAFARSFPGKTPWRSTRNQGRYQHSVCYHHQGNHRGSRRDHRGQLPRLTCDSGGEVGFSHLPQLSAGVMWPFLVSSHFLNNNQS